MKVLQIIASAYRGTLEEQDDTVVWLTLNMRGGGAELDVLLRGSAVCYGVTAQDAAGLAFGDKKQTQPPKLAEDIKALLEKGCKVFVVEDDVSERGISKQELIGGLTPVARGAIAKLVGQYDQVWHW